MRFSRKIAPEIKPRQNFITKKRLREDEIDFDKLRSYRLDRVRKESVSYTHLTLPTNREV